MSPEYLDHLANWIDPHGLWRKSPLDELTVEQSQQRDAGIALRRHAAHVRNLNSLLGTEYSLLITPLAHNVTRTTSWPTPERSAS